MTATRPDKTIFAGLVQVLLIRQYQHELPLQKRAVQSLMNVLWGLGIRPGGSVTDEMLAELKLRLDMARDET